MNTIDLLRENAKALTVRFRAERNPEVTTQTHRAITNAHWAIRQCWHEHTLPYEGKYCTRLLPDALAESWFCELNTLLNERVIPVTPRGNTGYEVSYTWEPLPDPEQFDRQPFAPLSRAGRAELEDYLHRVTRACVHDTLRRYISPLVHLLDALVKYTELEEQNLPLKAGPFRNSTLTNLHDLWERLPAYNVTHDDDVTELGNLLASLVHTDSDDLRRNVTLRASARTRIVRCLTHIRDATGVVSAHASLIAA
jgi:hypothetical protein